MLNLIDTAITIGKFQTFTRLLEGSSLEQKLRVRRTFTLFAPVDQAFSDLSATILATLLNLERTRLAAVLSHHVVFGEKSLRELEILKTMTSETGEKIQISCMDGLKINEARVVLSDVQAVNGVIHGIDRLLLPESVIFNFRT